MYVTLFSFFLLLAPAIVTATSPTLRCWRGDGCLRQWDGAAAVLTTFAGNFGGTRPLNLADLKRAYTSTLRTTVQFVYISLNCITDFVLRNSNASIEELNLELKTSASDSPASVIGFERYSTTYTIGRPKTMMLVRSRYPFFAIVALLGDNVCLTQ